MPFITKLTLLRRLLYQSRWLSELHFTFSFHGVMFGLRHSSPIFVERVDCSAGLSNDVLYRRLSNIVSGGMDFHQWVNVVSVTVDL